MPRPFTPVGVRLIRDTLQGPGGCILWQGSIDSGGYGQILLAPKGKLGMAHRAAWELWIGPIPEGMELDHLCKRRHCVNPEHLEVVTSGENKRRTRRELCKNGHSLAEHGRERGGRGGRACTVCEKEYHRLRYLRLGPHSKRNA